MKIPGITCSDTRRVVQAALDADCWEWGGLNGGGHGRLVHIPTGTVLTFGLTPRVASWKSLATDIKRVSGVEVWRKGSRKPGRRRAEAAESKRTQAERKALEQVMAGRAEANRMARAEHAKREQIAEQIAEADRRRREIRRLMMPGI